MQFIELRREFISLAKDQKPFVDAVRGWRSSLGWPELLKYRRVILLAEASCGKTQEFKNQRTRLATEGKASFFLAIETLADHGFAEALDWNELQEFERWREGTSDAWFFLDSVDEARLARKSFETALRRLARELGGELGRAFILVSSRITDWRGGDDFETFRRLLPCHSRAAARPTGDEQGDPLLDPIFVERKETPVRKPEIEPAEPIVVQLSALNESQYRLLARSVGVIDVDAFVGGIARHGLQAFTERPGDLLDIAGYWNEHRKFGPFAEMMEESVRRKLAEIDPHRPDNGVLPATKARQGAEQIAAALMFGKSFTLRAPKHDFDPALAADALDAAAILPSWTDEERNTLLRRGIFAPASYGRVRFHHRSTQEYLAAEWLHRLLQASCPQDEIWNILFVERYGVATVVPSLRPVAAWLAQRHPVFRDEIIRREPLILIRSGDPGSLSLTVKKKILKTYASMDAAGQTGRSGLESRSLGMFADQELAPAIRDAWEANPKEDFRDDLLRLIRDGAITACVGLAREVVSDKNAKWHLRVFALQALIACKDHDGLASAALGLLEAPDQIDSRLAASFARELYPAYLSTKDLRTLLRETIPAPKGSTAGFGYDLSDHYEATPSAGDRRELIRGLAEMCLTPPFVDPYRRVSARYRFLAKQVHAIAESEIKHAYDRPTLDLINLLMVAERTERRPSSSNKEDGLRVLVHRHRNFSHGLFWADVEEHRRNERSPHRLTRFWQVQTGGHQVLWSSDKEDRNYLFDQLVARENEDDRLIILSAIMAVSDLGPEREVAAERARAIVAGSSILGEEIQRYLAVPTEDDESIDRSRRMAAREAKQAAAEAKAKASWEEFAALLRSDPSLLSDPKHLATWKGGLFRLKHLLDWLRGRSNTHDDKALRDWRLLNEGFGASVAKAFRGGLRHIWRLSPAQRPVHTANNGVTVSWHTVLAYGAIGVEAAEDPDWTSHLTVQEAKRASEHGCFSEQGYPDWLDQLYSSFPEAVAPAIRKAVEHEWLCPEPAVSNLIHRLAARAFQIPPAVGSMVSAITLQHEAGRPETLGLCVDILSKSTPEPKTKAELIKMARARLTVHRRAGRDDYAFRYLALLFLIDPDYATGNVIRWIGQAPAGAQQKRAEKTFATLFNRHHPVIFVALDRVSVPSLEKLLYLAYHHIRTEDDLPHEGSFTPTERDDAESARSTLISALMERPGADAYEVLRRAASHSDFLLSAARFCQIAKEKAEQDAEIQAWLPAEIIAFEGRHIAPVKTGEDLFHVVKAVLRDIQFHLDHGDGTSRTLLERAADEDEVQKWLAEHLNFRAKERYHTHREAEVALGDKPDLIVSSTSAKVEVAIELSMAVKAGA